MRRGKAVGLLLLILLVGSMGVLGWLTYRQVRQDRLNHALIAAIKRQDAPAGLAALRAGADPNSREDTSKPLSFWQSLLHMFAGLRRQNKPSAPKPGQTALLLALDGDGADSKEEKHLTLSSLIRALVTRGANVNVRNKEGYTALILAAGQEPADTVQAMLDKGAKIDARDNDGQTALIWAAEWRDTDLVKTLLARGADVNARDNGGWTALINAAISGSMATVGSTATVKLLLAKGADVNAQGYGGITALRVAARNEKIDVVKMLLARGAKIDIRDDEGYTALMDTLFGPGLHAEGPLLYAVVACLLRHGASVHLKNVYGQSVLSEAPSLQDKQLLQLIREADARE